MVALVIYWSLIGWCGTIPPRIPPDPNPDPWWLNAVSGIIGGVAGGFLVSSGLGFDELIASSFGAFAMGRIVSEVGSLLARG